MISDQSKYDVVVVGCGYSGIMSALSAARAGARVCILEKAPHPGGISICSAGGLRISHDAGDALSYLEATNAGRTPGPVLAALARGMTELPQVVEELARVNQAKISLRPSPANYPFPGYESFGFVYVDEIPGVDIQAVYPHVRGNPAGALLFKVLEDNLRQSQVRLHCSCGVKRLLSREGRVCGVELDGGGQVLADRGVILACGGFEADQELQRQHWPGGPAASAAYQYNTGDGIRMAQAVGADLWHMWHYHGCYGFAPPEGDYPFGVRIKRLPDWNPGQKPGELPLMAWILLDQKGRRFMNEYEPYTHDTAARALGVFDPAGMNYPRNPAYLITDQAGIEMYPLAKPTFNDPRARLDWSPDNSREVESGLIKKAESLPQLAVALGLPPDEAASSVMAWNQACAQKKDPAFGRPGSSMHPLLKAPYYGAPLVPVISNTQGGPRRDERQRVLNSFGEPIPGLYAVGECGSSFGFLYMSGGNLAECFISGRVAGHEAAGNEKALSK